MDCRGLSLVLFVVAGVLLAPNAGAQQCNQQCPRSERGPDNCCIPRATAVGPPHRGETGSVYVTADVQGANVFLDGRPVGVTPVRLDGIPRGPHAVEVRTASATAPPQMVTVRPNALVPVAVTLPRAAAPAAPPYRSNVRDAFAPENNPAGDWSFGYRESPGATAFRLYDHHALVEQSATWNGAQPQPLAMRNESSQTIHLGGTTTIAPGQFWLHPGEHGEPSVARWTAPEAGSYRVVATFSGLSGYNNAPATTTDLSVVQGGATVLFRGALNLNGAGNEAHWEGSVTVQRGDTLDFVVGYGNGAYQYDSTALAAGITR
jgi:hypothetical protein